MSITPMHIIGILIFLVAVAGGTYLVVLVVRALLKYLRTQEIRAEKSAKLLSLGAVLKAHRTRCKMTQNLWQKVLG